MIDPKRIHACFPSDRLFKGLKKISQTAVGLLFVFGITNTQLVAAVSNSCPGQKITALDGTTVSVSASDSKTVKNNSSYYWYFKPGVDGTIQVSTQANKTYNSLYIKDGCGGSTLWSATNNSKNKTSPSVHVTKNSTVIIRFQRRYSTNINVSISFSFTAIPPANNNPSFTSSPPTSAQSGATYTYNIVTSDPDGDTVTVSAPTLPSWLSLSGNVLSGTPGASEAGNSYNVVLEADDGNGGTATQSFTIDVQAPASTPPVANDDTATTDRHTAVDIDVLSNDSDDNGDGAIDPSSVTITTQPANGTVSVDASSGTVTYTPDKPFDPLKIGDDTFQYTVKDINGQVSSPAKVTVTVTAGSNEDPVANDKSYTTPAGSPVSGNVITAQGAASGTADTDADGDLLFVTAWTSPSHGTLTLDQHSGTFTYTPGNGFVGQDQFNYTETDGYGAFVQATITIDVTAALVDLKIQKSVSSSVVSTGDSLDFTLQIDNPMGTSYTDAHNVVVTDTLPGGIGYDGISASGWNCQNNAGTITCHIDTLALDYSGTITIHTTALLEGNVTNTATITADTPEDNSGDNTSSVDVQILGTSADLSITKTASPSPTVSTASPLTYTLSVTNHGPDKADSVQITDNLPTNVQFVSIDGGSEWSCSQGPLIICDYIANGGKMPTGTAAPVTIKVTTPPQNDTVLNSADVTSSTRDPDTANNHDNASVDVQFGTNVGGSVPMSKYLQFNVFGDIKLIGNANINKNPGDPDRNYNDLVNMVFVDTDGSGSTFNSSSSTLNIDPSYTIEWAGLYWSGHICKKGNDGCSYVHLPSSRNNYSKAKAHLGEIKFKRPGHGYTSIVANSLNIVENDPDLTYGAFADITNLIDQSHINGPYTVANMLLTEGKTNGRGGNYGGWAMLVIYKDPANQVHFKNVSVFNGFQYINSDNNIIDIDGFVTPLSGPINSSIALFAADGDPQVGGTAKMRIKKTSSFDYIGGDALNPKSNLLNSTVSEFGTAINPGVNRTYGIDADRIDVSSFIDNNQKNTRFKFNVTNNQDSHVDYYSLSMFAFATDLVSPVIDGFEKSANIIDANGSVRPADGNASIYPGSKLQYTLKFKNTGDEIAQEVEIFDDFDFDGMTPLIDVAHFDIHSIKLSQKNSSTWQSNPNCGFYAGEKRVWCKIPTIGIGDEYKMQFTVTVKPTLGAADINKSLDNTAYSRYKNPTTGSYVVLYNVHGQAVGGKSNALSAGKIDTLGGGGNTGQIVPGLADIVSLTQSTVPTAGGYNGNTQKYITTQIVGKTPMYVYGVHLDKTTHQAVPFAESSINANLTFDIIPFLSDGACSTMTPLVDAATNQQAIISIPNYYSGVGVQAATFGSVAASIKLPFHATRNSRFKMIVVDPSKLSSAGQQCLLNSSQHGNFARVSQCANSKQQYRQAFGDDAWNRCGESHGKPCLSSNHGIANTGDPTYNPATDSIYTSELGCYLCTFDLAPSCSTDNFAIRPDRLVLDSTNSDFPGVFRAAKEYNLSLNAYDFDSTGHSGVHTVDYNVTSGDLNISSIKWLRHAGNTFSKDTANVLQGTFGLAPSGFLVRNGLSWDSTYSISGDVIGVTFDDVGRISVLARDQHWADVDINNQNDYTPNDCSSSGTYVCSDELNLTFIPDHFKVEPELHNFNDAAFTYLAKEFEKVGAIIKVKITAMNANVPPQPTKNFDKDDGFYENPLSLHVTAPVDPQGHLPNKTDTLFFDNVNLGFDDGVKTIDINDPQKLMFNYPRDTRIAVNPFFVNAADVNVNSWSKYINIGGTNDANITGTKSADGTNILFLYGRVHAPRYRVVQAAGTLPVYFEFYYDMTSSIDANNTLESNLSVDGSMRSKDAIYWYVNAVHNNAGDGNLTGISYSGSGSLSLSIDPGVNGGRQDFSYTYNGSDYPFRATIHVNSQPWLIYNRYDANADSVDVPLEINSDTAAGSSNGFNTSGDSDAKDAVNRPRRIQW